MLIRALLTNATLVVLLGSAVSAATVTEPKTEPASAPASASASAPSTTNQPVASIPDLTNDPKFLARCKAAAAYSAQHQGEGLVVMLDGQVVFEEAQGNWPLDRPHPLASGTKSFSGVAAALAIHDGLLSLDERVSDTITEWKSDPDKSRITVRHLLELSAGLDPKMEEAMAFRSGRRAEPVADHAKEAINASLQAKPGEKFIYGQTCYYIFGELMKRKFAAKDWPQENVVDYLQARVFDPLGISPRFGEDAAGNANLPGGCRLNARDWATFGELIRLNGKWDEKQLIDPKLLAQLFVPSATNPNYGLTWWLLRDNGENPEDAIRRDAPPISRRGEVGQKLGERLRERLRDRNQEQSSRGPAMDLGMEQVGVMAAGLGKQRLYVLPEFKLTVVRFGNLRSGQGFEDRDFLRVLIVGDEGEKQQTTR